MAAQNNSVDILSLVSLMFARLSDEEYASALAPGTWENVLAAANDLACDDAERARWAAALTPLGIKDRLLLQNEVFVAGLPLAVLPVESLYKPWSDGSGGDLGATHGLYLGDSAHHVRALYEQLAIEVPAEFAAMPDHVSLLCELLALYLENGNDAAARNLVADHFDWLGDYRGELALRAQRAVDHPTFGPEKKRVLAEGFAFLVALSEFLERLVHDRVGAG